MEILRTIISGYLSDLFYVKANIFRKKYWINELFTFVKVLLVSMFTMINVNTEL